MNKLYQRANSIQDVKFYEIVGKIGMTIGIIIFFLIVKSIASKEYYKVLPLLSIEIVPYLLILMGMRAETSDSYTITKNGISTLRQTFYTKKNLILYKKIKGIYISNAHSPYSGGTFSHIPLYVERYKNNEKKIVQTIWISLFKVEEVRFRDIPEASYHVKGLTSEEELYGFKYEKEVFEELLKNCDAHFYFTGNAVWEFTEEIGELFKKYGVTKERIHQLSENQVIHCKW